ncbi:glycosyltransferase [Sphingobacterium sp. NGMCC 1.201703]|uniref:glycosyltransferase n=1 Tax=Sphingobacterium sp. NGMCC 1.201703 TaxID=3388657 RepID=UPI0039FD8CAD
MKVLQIITSLETGGAEKLILESVPIYENMGLDVDVLVLKDSKTAFRDQLSQKISGNVIALTKKSVYNPLLILKLAKYLKKYNVIHAHLFPVLYWVVFAKIISFSSRPIVFTEHSTNNRRRNYGILKNIEKFVYSKLAFIGCISTGTFDSLTSFVDVKHKTEIINNGIDVEKFKNRGILAKSDFFQQDDFILIQVSSFRPQKDQETLINALLKLPPHVKLLLVGDGPLKKSREEQVLKLNLTSRVKFLGNRFDIPDLLNISDVVILSSIYEGFGLAIVEGMAAGKPVIASDVDGLREIVQNYGLLFEKGNSNQLCEQISRLLGNSEYYLEIAFRCSRRAEDFSIQNMVDKYLKIYKKLSDED